MPRRSAALPQRGFAMIAILALAALITAFLIASSLNRSSADVSNERDQRSMAALRQAKTALIAYAASEQWQLYKTAGTYFQPGALPCPDRDDDGDADCVGFGITATSSLIGRLPWKTIGADDLRDATGERLWYAVSHDFRKLRCDATTSPPNCTVINSDTQGQLTVVGTAPATQVVAVLFAPGEALSGQIRDPANIGAHNNPLNYLEGPPNLSDPVNYVFTTASPSGTFNDKVLVITQADLMAVVEPVVAARIERDIKPQINAYFSNFNNGYPYAAPFVSGGLGPGRPQQNYKGAVGQTTGLLPITTDPAFLTWQTSVSIVQIPGGTGNGTTGPLGGSCPGGGPCPNNGCTLDQVDCSSTTSSTISCRIDYCGGSNDRPAISLQATLRNGALSFAKRLGGAADVHMLDHDGNPVQSDPSGITGDWSWSTPLFVPTSSYAAAADGTASVVFQGRVQNAGSPPGGTGGRVFLTIPLPALAYDPLTSGDPTVNTTGYWFIGNQWYRQTYFAFSSGFGPAAGHACGGAAPACLTVKNGPASAQAILILTGRALNGSARPSTNPRDYLEGENCNLTAGKDLDLGSSPATCNLTTNDLLYEHRAGVATTINDRVVAFP